MHRETITIKRRDGFTYSRWICTCGASNSTGKELCVVCREERFKTKKF